MATTKEVRPINDVVALKRSRFRFVFRYRSYVGVWKCHGDVMGKLMRVDIEFYGQEGLTPLNT